MHEIIDAFPDYLSYWNSFRSAPLDDQIDGWQSTYMVKWPELLRKQIEDYEADGYDWCVIARERVFPNLEKSLPDMQVAYENLLNIIPPTLTKACRVLDYDGDLLLIIYVGIGLGAGWATTYGGRPAILFGLENIADCGWSGKRALTGLVAHELGHLVHFQRRDSANVPKGEGSWWQLYSEGYAMRSEHLVMGEESWHMREREGEGDWLDRCTENLARLAAEFLRKVEANEPVTPFFGKWFDLQGYRQTGYFLGHELLRLLEVDSTMVEIALLSEDDPVLAASVAKLAEQDGR
jgi:hypothetical protein